MMRTPPASETSESHRDESIAPLRGDEEASISLRRQDERLELENRFESDIETAINII